MADRPVADRVEEALSDLLATKCDCDEAWTGRNRHAPDCRWQFIHDFLDDGEIATVLDAVRSTAPATEEPTPAEWRAAGWDPPVSTEEAASRKSRGIDPRSTAPATGPGLVALRRFRLTPGVAGEPMRPHRYGEWTRWADVHALRATTEARSGVDDVGEAIEWSGAFYCGRDARFCQVPVGPHRAAALATTQPERRDALRDPVEGRTVMTDPVADREPLSGDIRAAISDAYYDARNDGDTMERAADNATAAVLATLDAVRAHPDEAGLRERIEALSTIQSYGQDDEDRDTYSSWVKRSDVLAALAQPAVPVAGAEDIVFEAGVHPVHECPWCKRMHPYDVDSAALRAAQPEDDGLDRSTAPATEARSERLCGCTADTELAAAPGCAVCGHRDHGRGGCRATMSRT